MQGYALIYFIMLINIFDFRVIINELINKLYVPIHNL